MELGGLEEGRRDVAALLQASGYRTIHVGKGHFGPAGVEAPNRRTSASTSTWPAVRSERPPATTAEELRATAEGRAQRRPAPGEVSWHGDLPHRGATLEAKAELTGAVGDGKPFFLYLAHYAVHAVQLRSAVRRQLLGLRQAGASPGIRHPDRRHGQVARRHPRSPRRPRRDRKHARFLSWRQRADAPLGHEHAVACAALRCGKSAHYEGGMRVPLIAAWAKADRNNPHQHGCRSPPAASRASRPPFTTCFRRSSPLPAAGRRRRLQVDGLRLDTLLAGGPDAARGETFLMHYPHAAPERLLHLLPPRGLEGDLPLFPVRGVGDSHYQLYDLAADPFRVDQSRRFRRQAAPLDDGGSRPQA